MGTVMTMERRADMFIDLEDDPRENGPTLGDERTTLVESLRCQRLTLEMKCAGLDAEALARRSIPAVDAVAPRSGATPRRDGARDVPGDVGGPGRAPACTAPPPTVTVTSTARFPIPKWSRRRGTHGGRRWTSPTQFVAEAPSLDITGDDPLNQHGSGGGAMSLREALVGMIEEYARHLGHADILREQIDGRIGQ